MTLSPLTPSALNAKYTGHSANNASNPLFHPPSHKMVGKVETINGNDEIDWDDGEPSSPFITLLPEEQQQIASGASLKSAAMSPAKLDLAELDSSPSPQKISPSKEPASFEICEDDTASMPPPSVLRFRASSAKSKSPIKTGSPNKQLFTEVQMSAQEESHSSISHSHSSTSSSLSGTMMQHQEYRSETMHRHQEFHAEQADLAGDTTALSFVTAGEAESVDDTCFSAFSEVHNADMTKFAQLNGRSPTKSFNIMDQTPRPVLYSSRNTPNTNRTAISHSSRSPSPTPSRKNGHIMADNDTTNLLLDFTQQFEAVSTLSQRMRAASRRSMSPLKSIGTSANGAEPQLLSYLNSQRSPRKGAAPMPSTPSSKNLLTLLDFELPPAPTPRSIPSITIRELESLKSGYASQISSLKATLSGREAEVEALKRAVSDAERRVGETAEEVREEKNKRECVEKEKEEWERRGKEFEEVLRRVKAEVMESEKEKEATRGRAEQSDERVRDLEQQLADAEERAARAESAKVDASIMVGVNDGDKSGNVPLFTAEQVQKQIDEKVHALSTELHAIYKKKHVTKVAGLKKGFEAKSKEMTVELQKRIEVLESKNDELQAKLDGTLSGVLPVTLAASYADTAERETERKKVEEQAALIERQKAALVGCEEELKTQRSEFATLMSELERERVEKGELVAAVDEMLALQADISVLAVPDKVGGNATTVEDVLRKSVGIGASARQSGLAKPGFGFAQSRIGQPSGLARPQPGKSRLMGNIERMGGGRSVE